MTDQNPKRKPTRKPSDGDKARAPRQRADQSAQDQDKPASERKPTRKPSEGDKARAPRPPRAETRAETPAQDQDQPTSETKPTRKPSEKRPRFSNKDAEGNPIRITAENRPPRAQRTRAGWDAVAAWYDGWVGTDGSEHHRRLAIPSALNLLNAQKGENVLDVGCGQGVLSPHIAETGANYTGVDLSPRLLGIARKHHEAHGQFYKADACKLFKSKDLKQNSYDAIVYLLSIQDIDPLEGAFRSAHWALKMGGRVIIVMTHPCFRIPRQSGWGTDSKRKLTYRRVDRYLTPLTIPMKMYPGAEGVTISFHRPLQNYLNTLGDVGLMVNRFEEIPSYKEDDPSNHEIPLFIALRAIKVSE